MQLQQIFDKLSDNQLKATLFIFATEFQIIWPVTLIALQKLRIETSKKCISWWQLFLFHHFKKRPICFYWIILVGLFVHILWKFAVAHYLHLLTNGRNQEPRKFCISISLWDFYSDHNSFLLFSSDKSTGWYWPDVTYK